MNLCSLVVVIDLEHVVVELMSWVFMIVKMWRELSCFGKFHEKWMN